MNKAKGKHSPASYYMFNVKNYFTHRVSHPLRSSEKIMSGSGELKGSEEDFNLTDFRFDCRNSVLWSQ